MPALTLSILLALPLHADIYDRLDELPHHLRSGGVPRDGIPAMTNPQAVIPSEIAYLNDGDLVLGVALNGEARAYPHSLGWKHEIINDQLGGQYICVTFCPLTGTGLVFDGTAPDSSQIELGVSGMLINSNMVMYDRGDEDALYPQMIYANIGEKDTGRSLTLMPVVETTWKLWRKMHPHTSVPQAATGLAHYPSYIRALYTLETYLHYPYGDYRSDHGMIIFDPTTAQPSKKIAAKEMVLGLRAEGASKAYPFAAMPDRAAINDRLGNRDLLVIFDRHSRTAIPYSRRIGGLTLTFGLLDRKGDLPLTLADFETGSEWNMLGQAVGGTLIGTQLMQWPAYNSMWFSWSAYWPQTQLWNGEGILPPP